MPGCRVQLPEATYKHAARQQTAARCFTNCGRLPPIHSTHTLQAVHISCACSQHKTQTNVHHASAVHGAHPHSMCTMSPASVVTSCNMMMLSRP